MTVYEIKFEWAFAKNLKIKGYPVSSLKNRQSCYISRYVVTCLGKWGANFRATPGSLQRKKISFVNALGAGN